MVPTVIVFINFYYNYFILCVLIVLMNIIHIIILVLVLWHIMRDSKTRDPYQNIPNDIGGCVGCVKRDMASGMKKNICQKSWGTMTHQCDGCDMCYDPQYQNNSTKFRYADEKLIGYGSKICQCTQCSNSQTFPL